MEIDENRSFTLTKYSTKVGEKKVKESDHNTMIMKIKSNWVTLVNDDNKREEIYNYKNEDDSKKFKDITENNQELMTCFDDPNEDIDQSASRWISEVNKNIKRSFRRIRIKIRKSNKDLDPLFERKEYLKSVLKTKVGDQSEESLKEELENVTDEIAKLCAEKNKETVYEYLGRTKDTSEGFNAPNTWALKKKLAPKNTNEPPMAKKDKNGKLVTEKAQL